MIKHLLIVTLTILIFLTSCKEEKENKNEVSENHLKFTEVTDAVLASGKLQCIDSFPSKNIVPRTVDIWLPDGYSNDKKYAVVYMHDGQNLFDATKTWNKQEWRVDEIVTDLIQKDSIRDMIVVAIWNISEIRHQDYFPEKAFDLLLQKDKDSLTESARKNNYDMIFNADEYLKFITEELKPTIDKQFSTLSDSKNTFIAGSSMGGLISMYAICEYPDVFGGAACISTHWPGVMPADYNPVPNAIFKYMKANVPMPGNHKFYFDYGTQTLDKHYPQYLDDVDSIFFGKGYTIKNYMNLEFEGADHSEDSWNRRFDIPLTFLLKK